MEVASSESASELLNYIQTSLRDLHARSENFSTEEALQMGILGRISADEGLKGINDNNKEANSTVVQKPCARSFIKPPTEPSIADALIKDEEAEAEANTRSIHKIT